ncbi:MAG: lamin tail domain-containing protein [Candidatus Zambryskibacteria bacterium]|nr:lamin tail domain-containing protein [Candidatus Zambryskibacteria bacterium]
MKVKIIVILLLFFIFPLISSAQVVISEIAWMGNFESANAEWIELYNSTSDTTDLSGWTLKAVDGSPDITISGSVQGESFFIMERTSDNSILGIVADMIYSGALENSGETLVLSDSSGKEIDRIDNSGKWFAGDNNTKETMQLSGTSWITAPSTPGFGDNLSGSESNPVGEVLGASDDSSNDTVIVSGGENNTYVSSLNSKLEVLAGEDRVASPGSPIWLQATIKKNTTGGSPNLEWSFGDGNVGVGPLVNHSYKYPGNYVVVLSARVGDIFSVSRLMVKVSESNITVSDEGEYLEITNQSNTEINLFNWKIEHEGKGFIFQPNTVILPRSSISFDKELLKMKGFDNSRGIALKNCQGKLVFSVAEEIKPDFSEISKSIANIRNEALTIQNKARQAGFMPENNVAGVYQVEQNLVQIAEIEDNAERVKVASEENSIIYEVPKNESFIKKAWNFLVSMLN